MRDVDPADIPEHGSRHDFTLSKVGPARMKEDSVVVQAVIDNGDFCGKTVSTTFPANSHELHEFAEALGVSLSHYDGDWREYLSPLLSLRLEKRFSASLAVEPVETKKIRGYKYGFTFVDSPSSKPEIRLRKHATQFQR